MNDKHVVSLELSKKLKDNNYPQEGEFWWVGLMTDINGKWCGHIIHKDEGFDFNTRYVAPLASELMEKLPEEIITKHTYSLNIGKWNDRYNVTYNWEEGNDSGSLEGAFQSDNNLCDALALMWIYLKGKGLL